jgi:hypothetical protein
VTDIPPGLDDVRPLAADPLGRLYLARRDNAEVAARVLDVSVPGRAERRQFRRSCLVALPGQRGVLQLHEVDFTAGHQPYLVADAPTGILAAQLAVASLAPQQAVWVAEALARTLAEAHQHGVVHLDVRPENVVQAGTGDPLLAWFGVCRAASVAGQAELPVECLVHAGRELFGWDTPGPPADVYGLGSTLYTMLSGAAPYAGEARLGRASLYSRILRGGPPPIARPGIRPGLVDIIAAMMDPDPANRPGPAEVAESLGRLHDEDGTRREDMTAWPLPAQAGPPAAGAAPRERNAAVAADPPAHTATLLASPSSAAAPGIPALPAVHTAAPVPTTDGASEPKARAREREAPASAPTTRRGRHGGLLLLLGIGLVALAAGLVWGAVTGPTPQHPRTIPSPTVTASAKPIPAGVLAGYRVTGIRLTRKADGILVSWSAPATRAGVNAFLVAGESGGLDLPVRTVGPAAHAVFFPGLRPGPRYCFAVSTIIETASRQTGTAATPLTCTAAVRSGHRQRHLHRHTHPRAFAA